MAALHKNHLLVKLQFGLLGALASLPVFAVELTIQIGAFGDRPNASFAEQAAEYGELLVLRGDDGITRVSIGRYDNRTAARDALQRLQIAGYTDAYIANLRGRGTETADTSAPSSASGLPPAPTVRTPKPASRPINNPATARTQANAPSTSTSARRPLPTTPKGRPIVAPKRPNADDSTVTQAGRFRLRTHDTQSGKTSDVKLVTKNKEAGSTTKPGNGPVIAGLGVNEIPQHLREKLVYLDGVPHIKEGDTFIPLNDAVDGK